MFSRIRNIQPVGISYIYRICVHVLIFTKISGMITGEKLRLLRLLKGFKQKNVADKLGITQQAYSKLEKRTVINDSMLEKIITSMNCTTEDIDAINRLAS